jgi:hypothetical protein
LQDVSLLYQKTLHITKKNVVNVLFLIGGATLNCVSLLSATESLKSTDGVLIVLHKTLLHTVPSFSTHYESYITILDDWLTVHHSITSVNFQLDAQNSLFIYI